MSGTITRCPYCETRFRVTDEQLAGAGGQVRCGRCYGIFEAVAHQDNSPKKAPPSTPTETTNNDTHSDESINPVLLEELETLEAQETPNQKRGLPLLAAPAGLLLCAALVFQYGYFNRDTLAKNPQLRPHIALMCDTLTSLSSQIPCQLAPLRSAKKIKLVKRSVTGHPQQKNALLVEGVINNSADFAQPFPTIELRFQDINGITRFGRRFDATEYLADTARIDNTLLAPNQSVAIKLELIDPGNESVGFEFNFL